MTEISEVTWAVLSVATANYRKTWIITAIRRANGCRSERDARREGATTTSERITNGEGIYGI